MNDDQVAAGTGQRISELKLDERSVVRRNADVEHERAIAIFDLLEENFFDPAGCAQGPYHVRLSLVESRLVIDIWNEADEPLDKVNLPLISFRRLIKDYFTVCETYFTAIKTASPSKIQAIDMGRRGLHNEGSDLLRERLDGKIAIDHNTARRLFTLLCVLHIKG